MVYCWSSQRRGQADCEHGHYLYYTTELGLRYVASSKAPVVYSSNTAMGETRLHYGRATRAAWCSACRVVLQVSEQRTNALIQSQPEVTLAIHLYRLHLSPDDLLSRPEQQRPQSTDRNPRIALAPPHLSLRLRLPRTLRQAHIAPYATRMEIMFISVCLELGLGDR